MTENNSVHSNIRWGLVILLIGFALFIAGRCSAPTVDETELDRLKGEIKEHEEKAKGWLDSAQVLRDRLADLRDKHDSLSRKKDSVRVRYITITMDTKYEEPQGEGLDRADSVAALLAANFSRADSAIIRLK